MSREIMTGKLDDDPRLPAVRRAMLHATLGMWRDQTDSDKRAREFLCMFDAAMRAHLADAELEGYE